MLKIRITGTKKERKRLMQLLVELEKKQALTITSQSKEYVNRDKKQLESISRWRYEQNNCTRY